MSQSSIHALRASRNDKENSLPRQAPWIAAEDAKRVNMAARAPLTAKNGSAPHNPHRDPSRALQRAPSQKGSSFFAVQDKDRPRADKDKQRVHEMMKSPVFSQMKNSAKNPAFSQTRSPALSSQNSSSISTEFTRPQVSSRKRESSNTDSSTKKSKPTPEVVNISDIPDDPAAPFSRTQAPSHKRESSNPSASSKKTKPTPDVVHISDIPDDPPAPRAASSLPVPDSKNALTRLSELSDEQRFVFDLVVHKKQSVFFTGSAGTGKSVLLREIIRSLRKKYDNDYTAVAVTAPTGLAACNIGGQTIHAFGGLGIGREDAQKMYRSVRRNTQAYQRWDHVKVLIVDEVSMLDGELLDKIEFIASKIKKRPRFGGIQLIFTGDFFQLPPVPDKGKPATFAFDAACWSRCIDHTIKLTRVFRQRDTDFVDMLNELRHGSLSSQSIAKFKRLSRPAKYNDNILPTELFPRRESVEHANSLRLANLPGPTKVYDAKDMPGPNVTDITQIQKGFQMLDNLMAPKSLHLKVGAQVMLVKNLDQDLVNGTLGTIVSFGHYNPDMYDAPGSGPTTSKLRDDTINARARMSSSESEVVPYIQWTTLPQGTVLPQARVDFNINGPDDRLLVKRRQLPIILSWAMSIHKSQGQTLPRVKVDLGKVFEKGQSYVALSRATSLDTLQILNFDASKVRVHPRVAQWNRDLKSVQMTERRDDRDDRSPK